MRLNFFLLIGFCSLAALDAHAQADTAAATCLLKAAGLRLVAEERTKFLNDCYANSPSVGQQNSQPKPTSASENAPNVQLPRPKPSTVGASSSHLNEQDALKCVQKLIARWVTAAHSTLRCGDFLKLDRVRVISKQANGTSVDLSVEIHLRTSKAIPGTGIVASSCTGAEWERDIAPNKRIVLKKLLSFNVASRQAVCETDFMEPIIDGDAAR